MKGATVRIDAVSRSFGTVRAVDNISLDIGAGEFVSMLGPSGSGKTTLLMMIAGFEFPDTGSILVNHRDVTYLPANRRDIGMVFQRYALFPHMSVTRNITFPLKIRGLPRSEISGRVERMLELVQLEGLGDRMPAQLSGGQQQRVAVARALVFEPPVLLMDEPLGALDKKLREQMQFELKQLHDRIGVTIIYVTHDQEEALTMSDRVVILDRGGIEQVGGPLDLYLTPANPFVAEFVGRMNLLPGTVDSSDTEAVTVVLESGQSIQGRRDDSAGSLISGKPVRIAFRPENIAVSNASGASGGANRLTGTIASSVFVGSYFMLLVDIGAGTRLIVQIPGIPAAGLYEHGDQVALELDPEAVHVFSAPENMAV